jgi:hypothetical protein
MAITQNFVIKERKIKRKSNPWFTDEYGAPFSARATQQQRYFPIKRIGEEIETQEADATDAVEDEDLIPHKISIARRSSGSLGLLGTANIAEVNSFRYGKDVKTIKNFLNDKLAINVSLSREGDFRDSIQFDNRIESCNFGQANYFTFYNRKNNSTLPFTDIEGKPLPQNYLGDEDAIKGFPFVHDGKQNIENYLNPEEGITDGSIDVIETKMNALSKNFSDLKIKGAKGLFGVGNWELTQHSTSGKKGSAGVTELFEVGESSHDYFEDATETMLTKAVPGFISMGQYKIRPFQDKDIHKNDYEHVSSTVRLNLLLTSSRDVSEIGTRFKSKQNGFIMTPFYGLTEKRSFGKDSIAFSGLLKG